MRIMRGAWRGCGRPHPIALGRSAPPGYRDGLRLVLQTLTLRRLAEAEAYFKEAAAIKRALAAQDPSIFQPDVATLLTNLGDLYAETHRVADAEAALKRGRRHPNFFC